LRAIAGLSASRAPARALTTISTAGSSCWCWRKDSLINRLRRLRLTAPPMTRAAIDNPSRGAVPPFGRTNTAKRASENRRASRYTRSNSDLLRRRCAAVNDRVREGKSNGQALTPLGAAPSQHLAAGTRGHARTEPVSARAMQVAGLVSELHDFRPAENLALKQAQGAAKEGRQAEAPRPRVSSEALVRTGVGGKFRSVRRGPPPVDNPAG